MTRLLVSTRIGERLIFGFQNLLIGKLYKTRRNMDTRVDKSMYVMYEILVYTLLYTNFSSYITKNNLILDKHLFA